jgi:hypothetical protein
MVAGLTGPAGAADCPGAERIAVADVVVRRRTTMLKSALAIAIMGFVVGAAYWPADLRAQQAPAVSLEQATKIARDAGLVMIREIELDDGKWEIEGRNQAGESRELHIDAGSGKVLRDGRD